MTSLANELKIVNDFEEIYEVNIEEIVSLNGELPTVCNRSKVVHFIGVLQVIIFLNSSYRTIEDFKKSASILTKLLWEQLMRVNAKSMHFLMGNNNRLVWQ